MRFPNPKIERSERRLKYELENLISLAEDRNTEIEKKDELIFGLFEQVDQLKDNIELLQNVSPEHSDVHQSHLYFSMYFIIRIMVLK